MVSLQVLWGEAARDSLGLQDQARGRRQGLLEALFWHLDWNLKRKDVTGRGPRMTSLPVLSGF